MRIAEIYNEVDELVNPLNDRITVLMSRMKCNPRVQKEVAEELDLVSFVIGEIGAVQFRLRHMSWEVLRDFHRAAEVSSLSYTVSSLRTEINSLIGTLHQSSMALQERSRALRSFLSY